MAHIFGDPPDRDPGDYITLGGIFQSVRVGILLAKIIVALIFLPFVILGKILKPLDPIVAAWLNKRFNKTPGPSAGEPPNVARGLVNREK
ncbi:MAG: hypothetical protein ABSB33_06770 [Tepidisphaeraceae bacterium]|jgi:hypothetical protein